MKRARTILLVALLSVSCGKEGPPLPPLRIVPSAVTNLDVRRQGNEVRFTFALPTRNLGAEGPVNLERVEIYGATVAAGAEQPSNQELVSIVHRIANIEVRQPPAEEPGKPRPGGEKPVAEPPKPAQPELPGPGDTVSYVDVLTEDRLKPYYTKPAPEQKVTVPVPAPTTAKPDPKTEVPVLPVVAKRIYVIRPLARGRRPGQVSQRIEVPLLDAMPVPTALKATYNASSIALSWTAPAGETPVTYNVYQPEGGPPLNANPLKETSFERPGIEFGKEQCFVVRTTMRLGILSIESDASERACVTPADTFAPEAPKGLSAVSGTSVISLIWDANTEPDLAGYVVLRAEAPGDTLLPITPKPIRETNFRDTTVKPGVRYIYAVVAVDTAAPPNTSPQSARVEETAR